MNAELMRAIQLELELQVGQAIKEEHMKRIKSN
jgi:hypothetical protein